MGPWLSIVQHILAVPERKIGFEALEASVKLRISSIDCLSAATFEAARRGATEAKGRQLL